MRHRLGKDTSKIPQEILDRHKVLEISSNPTSRNMFTGSVNCFSAVRTAQRIVLPPNSQMIVRATVSYQGDFETDIYAFEPCSNLSFSKHVIIKI